MIVRKRIEGQEQNRDQAFKVNSNFGKKLKADSWWTDEHDIKLEVTGEGSSKKLKVFIDNVLISDDYSFESDAKSDNNYTGFRTWHTESNFSELEIQGK